MAVSLPLPGRAGTFTRGRVDRIIANRFALNLSSTSSDVRILSVDIGTYRITYGRGGAHPGTARWNSYNDAAALWWYMVADTAPLSLAQWQAVGMLLPGYANWSVGGGWNSQAEAEAANVGTYIDFQTLTGTLAFRYIDDFLFDNAGTTGFFVERIGA